MHTPRAPKATSNENNASAAALGRSGVFVCCARCAVAAAAAAAVVAALGPEVLCVGKLRDMHKKFYDHCGHDDVISHITYA